MIKRGSGFYGVYCRACHGTDLRGGDQGGPNLLRSQLVLNDQDGELITAGRPAGTAESGHARHAAAEHSTRRHQGDRDLHPQRDGQRPGQGAPPEGPPVELNIVVGDAKAGQAYFTAKCATVPHRRPTCRASRRASRIRWRSRTSGSAAERGGGGRGGAAPSAGDGRRSPTPRARRPKAGSIRLDDFYVVVALADGTSRSFRRDGDVPKVEVKDPREAHRKLLPTYADKDIHDVTAYLVTLK